MRKRLQSIRILGFVAWCVVVALVAYSYWRRDTLTWQRTRVEPAPWIDIHPGDMWAERSTWRVSLYEGDILIERVVDGANAYGNEWEGRTFSWEHQRYWRSGRRQFRIFEREQLRDWGLDYLGNIARSDEGPLLVPPWIATNLPFKVARHRLVLPLWLVLFLLTMFPLGLLLPTWQARFLGKEEGDGTSGDRKRGHV
jgi:hypothetical protein